MLESILTKESEELLNKMENLSRVFQKQKSKKTHEKNELYNSIED